MSDQQVPGPAAKGRRMASRNDYQSCSVCGTRWFANEVLPCPKCSEGPRSFQEVADAMYDNPEATPSPDVLKLHTDIIRQLEQEAKSLRQSLTAAQAETERLRGRIQGLLLENDDFREAIAKECNRADAAQAELQRMREALGKISRIGDCCCDHSDENCCNLVGHQCVTCIAEAALRTQGGESVPDYASACQILMAALEYLGRQGNEYAQQEVKRAQKALDLT